MKITSRPTPELSASTQSDRLNTLDGLRGVAVMGILLMNIFSFAMPSAAYFNPRAYGADGVIDYGVWSFNFILIDSKMRALFSLLFGASMLLFIERADASGQDSIKLHLRRMAFLFVFGWIHYALLWDGDILTLYAAVGVVAFLWRWLEPRELIKLSIGFTVASLLLWASVLYSFHKADAAGLAPRASVEAVEARQTNLASLGEPDSSAIDDELDLFKSGYGEIVAARAVTDWAKPLRQIVSYGFETMGLILLGMALLKNGFLRGEWPNSALWRVVSWGYGIGVTGMILLWLISWHSGFDVMTNGGAVLLWSLPFRIPVMLGHAGLILILLRSLQGSAATQRIEAVGKTAFSNYILMSLILGPIFYGYGLGLFGELFRWEAYLLVIPIWGVMLLWSKPWMTRFSHGPLEWVWRCLTRWEWVPMQRG
jgi:uncharacterized protein